MIASALLAATLSASPSSQTTLPITIHLGVGFPWTSLALDASSNSGLSIAAEAETALGRRWESRLLLGKNWRVHRSLLLRSSLGTGWVIQGPSVPRQGVQLLARIGAIYQGAYSPFVILDYRFLNGLRELAIQSASGTRTEWIVTPYASILGQVGVRRAISSSLELEVRMIFGEIDAVFAIPGAAFGLRWSTS